jgi:diguanylate cyclase (GGDEF)-like protein
MESKKSETTPTREESRKGLASDSYIKLSRQLSSEDSVDLATLDSYLNASKITHQQYIELSRKLLKRHEHIEEGLVNAAEKLENERTKLETERGTDILTGLYNRLFLKDRLGKLITELNIEEKRHPERKAVVVVKFDLKGLSEKNALGHDEVGDKFLKDFADTLTKKIARRGNDSAFRVGGDEFTVLLSIEDGDMDEHQVEDIIQKVLQSIKNKVAEVAYVGYASLKKGETIEAEELLTQADQDMVRNKIQEKSEQGIAR